MHALYVEDDPLSREIMAVLMRASYPAAHLTVLPDSADFAARLEALPEIPALVLLDVHVQPLDGFQMLRVLRADRRFAASHIVAVTASVMNQEIVSLRTAGFDGAIGKPLDFDRFAMLIGKILDGEEVWYVT